MRFYHGADNTWRDEPPQPHDDEVQVWYQHIIGKWGMPILPSVLPGAKPEVHKPDPDKLRETHALVARVPVDDPDNIYWKMQGENWSPEGEANELIRSCGVRHTSMSVGDVLIDKNGAMLMVAFVGWEVLRREWTDEEHAAMVAADMVNGSAAYCPLG